MSRTARSLEARLIDVAGLQALIDALLGRGLHGRRAHGAGRRDRQRTDHQRRRPAGWLGRRPGRGPLPAAPARRREAVRLRDRRAVRQAGVLPDPGGALARRAETGTSSPSSRTEQAGPGRAVRPDRRPLVRPERPRHPRHRADEPGARGRQLRGPTIRRLHRRRHLLRSRAAPASASPWAPARIPSRAGVRRTTWRSPSWSTVAGTASWSRSRASAARRSSTRSAPVRPRPTSWAGAAQRRRGRRRADGSQPRHLRAQGAALRERREPDLGRRRRRAACPAPTARRSARPASAPAWRT